MTLALRRHAVSDWVFEDEESCPPAGMLADDGTLVQRLACARGQFALHALRSDGTHVLARDGLGVNKLFFALTAGDVESSNYAVELVRRGHSLRSIWSVPSGHVARIHPARRALSLERHSELAFQAGAGDDLDVLAADVWASLASTFRSLATGLSGRPLYVALSGGLDSTAIACLAREHLGPFVAVTFAMEGRRKDAEDDLHHAQLVAERLGVTLEVVWTRPDDVLEELDVVLLRGQDWRDFNVHCGLVNARLARAIAARHPDGPRPVVLTGDTMNELMADYEPVSYGGREFYSLPRLAPGRLRRFLVDGLDSGDREVGIFAHLGVDAIQPYAMCAPAYAVLPEFLMHSPGAKADLVRRLLGERVPEAVYRRKKVRAQVGSAESVGGTLAVLADAGMDSNVLAERLAALLGVAPLELRRWIRAGWYRFTTDFPNSELPT